MLNADVIIRKITEVNSLKNCNIVIGIYVQI